MNRTPVSILQELTRQRKGAPPHYEWFLSERFGTHLPTFHYRVFVENVVADGKAGSKKEAKHTTARNALEKLCSMGVYHPTHVDTPLATSSSSHSIPAHLQVNAVGALQDLCSKNNIQQPTYEFTVDIGLSHCLEFTVECKIAMLTTASAPTKKKAKQLAAQRMLHHLMESLPPVVAELSVDDSSSGSAVSSENIATVHNELTQKKPNCGQKMSPQPNALKAVMKEKNLTYETLWQDIRNKDELDFRNLLNLLGLDYTLEYMENEGNILATVTIDCEQTFAVCDIAASKQEAYFGAIHKSLELLNIMTKY